jgi:hypothetical protein
MIPNQQLNFFQAGRHQTREIFRNLDHLNVKTRQKSLTGMRENIFLHTREFLVQKFRESSNLYNSGYLRDRYRQIKSSLWVFQTHSPTESVEIFLYESTPTPWYHLKTLEEHGIIYKAIVTWHLEPSIRPILLTCRSKVSDFKFIKLSNLRDTCKDNIDQCHYYQTMPKVLWLSEALTVSNWASMKFHRRNRSESWEERWAQPSIQTGRHQTWHDLTQWHIFRRVM